MYRYTKKSKRPLSPAVIGGDGPGDAREAAVDLLPPSGSPEPDAPDSFVRDAPTVLSYAALGCFTFWLYAFAPAVTLLRDELGFSYSVLGFYEVCWSAGAALAGAGFAWTARHLSRGSLLWGSALATALGAGLFVLGRGVPATLAGAAVFGTAGTMLLTVIQAILSDRHGSRRDRALTEANIGAGVSAVFAPLAIGALAATVIGWRAAFALPAAVFVLLFLRYRNRPLPAPARQHAAEKGGRLPLACWLFAVLTAISSAVEFCLVYFGPQMLIDSGFSAAAASTALSSNLLGILIGRLAGARLTRRPGRTVHLLYWSLAVSLASVVLFWLTDQPVLAITALFLSGIGIANLYPLSLALTLGAADGQEDRANARSQLILGLIAAASPFVLGSLADQYGLAAGFALEPVLIAGSFLLLWGGLRSRRHTG
ncbi:MULTISPECIES: MFS transporter [unclassified Micromonospora]|uniref:MFS transporter n=1 Tax=unclassified Micromonospora TaxID=2617518 RepID=UPI001B3688FC|nr:MULTISPECIES: MFS transporter [unclassified Micromonospora]MBQ1044359.1 MFS transporter [Micromonospora sp. C72]MBQ1056863.1 MFS transporter [Micromonospora sp. C32]